MFCGNCGVENGNSAKFCKSCGHPLVITGGAGDGKKTGAPLEKTGRMAVAKDASGIQRADALQPGEKRKAMPKKALVGIGAAAAAVAALAVILWFAVSAGSTINLNQYLIIEEDGYDGYGTVKAGIDWEAIEEKYGAKVSLTEKAKSELGGFTNLASPAEFMQEYIRVKLDRSDRLSNGDEIAYVWDVDEDFSKYIKCKIKYTDGSYGVSGLAEVETFDAFADLEVTFSGVGPDGKAELEYKGKELDSFDFGCDKKDGLSNGDTVTVSISNAKLEGCAESLGKVPETLEKKYKVEGLSSYITSMSEISAESLESMKRQASDVYHAYVAKDWEEDAKLESFDYIGNYLLTEKNPDTAWGSHNVLYLVYKARARNTYSNGEETYDKAVDVYWYLSYADLLAEEDGSLTVNVAYYGTPNARFTVDSGISSGWFSTRSWYYYGYETLDALYEDVVTSNMDAYNHEDHVDENAFPAASDEGGNEGGGTAYILPDSNVKLLSEQDLEGLSDEECKLARNEIYARHGRKFKDEKLQAYFDARDWYEGTIEPDDFEESLLSEIEIANRDLLVAHEKKKK